MEINKRDIYVLTLKEIMEKFNIPQDKHCIRSHTEKAHSWDDKDDRLIMELIY